ncbi:hypothetical protein ACYF6T_07995 [Streptomyces sp. 7R007]
MLDRWKVDYLVQQVVSCDELMDVLSGASGLGVAEGLLLRRVYGAIAEVYPELGRECERRLGLP